MAEQLLNRAKVRAALQQVRRERVAERVRMGVGERRRLPRGQARPDPQPPPHVGGPQPSPRLGHEQRAPAVAAGSPPSAAPGGPPPGSARSPAGRALRPARAGSCRPCPRRGRSRRRSRRAEVERHELLGAQAGRVGELEQRAVAQRQRRGRWDPVQQHRNLVGLEHARQPLRALGADSSSAGLSRARRASPARRTARAARRACARRWSAPGRAADSVAT